MMVSCSRRFPDDDDHSIFMLSRELYLSTYETLAREDKGAVCPGDFGRLDDVEFHFILLRRLRSVVHKNTEVATTQIQLYNATSNTWPPLLLFGAKHHNRTRIDSMQK